MKKVLAAGIIVLALFSCDAGSMKGWSSGDKDAFMKECVSGSKKSAGMSDAQANEYCNCVMSKLEIKYPDPLDVTKVTDAEMNSFADSCNKQ